MIEKKISLIDLEQTWDFASKLANITNTGDVITFNGDLGVGKTTFIKSFINKLASEDVEVTSPTFNLLHLYKLEKFEIWHFDLYRIKNKEEIFELGIEDAFEYGISLIEWPEIIRNILPRDRLEIEISFGESEFSREIILKAYGTWKNKIINGI